MRGRSRSTGVSRTPESLSFQATQAGDIIAFAYDLPLDRVEHLPQWMYDYAYNVTVTSAAPASLPGQKVMLQKLLEERFGLAVHRISYPSPVYFLVKGPNVKLTPAQEPDSADLPEISDGVLRHASMRDLADRLYPRMGLPVLDQTGITGLFDIAFPGPAYGLPTLSPFSGAAVTRGGAEGTIKAVYDALGLILEVHQGTAESLIIDSSEKPKEN